MLMLSWIVLLTPKICVGDYGFSIYKIRPLSVGRGKGRLKEIDSMLRGGHIYRSSDVRTWAHETTHGINSRGRQILQGKYNYKINTIYILDGRLAVLREPSLTLSQIARNVPRALRGQHTYSLYLVQQQKYWNSEPLYVLDELSAYTNGTVVGIEYGKDTYSDEWFALDFLAYTLTLCEMADKIDYNTNDLFNLTKYYCMWHSHNLRQALLHKHKYYSKYSQQYKLMHKYYGGFVKSRFGIHIYTAMFKHTQNPPKTKFLTLMPEETVWKEVR